MAPSSLVFLFTLSVSFRETLQCASRAKVPEPVDGIRSERLIQLPDTRDTPTSLEADYPQLTDNELSSEPESRVGKQISETVVDACPELTEEGFKFYLSVVREEVAAQNVESCAVKCKQAAYCRSFAFSTIEGIEENCQLSELSAENLSKEEQITEDSNWNVYGVAEGDNCNKSEDQTTTNMPKSENCKCNGFIDTFGGGECRQENGGHWWCYVDEENDCADSMQDSSMPVFSRSYQACKQGPCECNTFGLKRFRNQETCMTDIFDDDKFCYVPLESRCKDKRASKFFPSVYWSMKACADDNKELEDDEEEGSGDDKTEKVMSEEGVTYHKTWNFTSSHTECANYCHNSERCQYMHSKYDAMEGICQLSTQPFYVVTHIHYGNQLGAWIKK